MWGLNVNTSKTTCMAFKKNGRIAKGDSWNYNGEKLKTVSQFKYLGFTFGSSGKYIKGINSQILQAERAFSSLKCFFFI